MHPSERPRSADTPDETSSRHDSASNGERHKAATAAAIESQAVERNRLLRVIPPEEYAWLQPHLMTVRIEHGQILAEPDEPFRYVYFPETMVVSQVNRMEDGSVVEVGTIGNEGMVGISLFLDADALPSRTLVQVAGEGKRMPAEVFGDGAQARPQFQRLLRRYTHAYLTQVAQTAACNRMHSLDERCARWLLMTHDRVGRAEQFVLTHEFLAFMLGVRRAGVTIAAGALQQAGIIRYSRGKITVLDRAALESASCECYGIVREHFERLLGRPG